MDLSKCFFFVSFSVVVFACITASEHFELSSSPSTTGEVSEDVVLLCQISLGKQLQNMKVQWKKFVGNHVINVYQFTALTDQETFGQGYQNRAVLMKNGIASGNVSLMLKKVRVTDEGIYSCIVKSIDWSADIRTVLHVVAVGNVSVEISGPEGDGIKVACRSAGWFPKPDLHWLAESHQTNQQCESKQDHEQLFSISSNMTVLRDMGEITCLVQESRSQMRQNFTIFLSRNVFPSTSPWLPAFWILFIVALLGFGVVAYGKYREKHNVSEKKHTEERAKMIQDSQLKTKESEIEDLQRMLERAQTELEFREARSYLVQVHLDPKCKHPELLVSQDCSRVHHQSASRGAALIPGALMVVGNEGFGDGRQYWQVNVKDAPNWELGVLTEDQRNKLEAGKLDALEEEQSWSLRRSDGSYHPKEADSELRKYTIPLRVVGIYLDRNDSSVSFYHMKCMTAILKMPVTTTSEKLYPFFSLCHSKGDDREKALSLIHDKNWDFPEQLEAF